MLQCRILHYAKSAPPNSADLNTALNQSHDEAERRARQLQKQSWHGNNARGSAALPFGRLVAGFIGRKPLQELAIRGGGLGRAR
jgi:hypothetical protein